MYRQVKKRGGQREVTCPEGEKPGKASKIEKAGKGSYLPCGQKCCGEVYNQCIIENYSGVFRFMERVRHGCK